MQGPYAWARCAECGFAFLDPMPAGDAQAVAEGQRAHGAGYIHAYSGRKLVNKYWRSAGRVLHLRRYMPGRRLLDVGANVGILVATARRMGLEAVGLEVNPDLVAEAERRHPRARFLCGTLEEADLAGAAFDGIYCSEVIEHVPDVEAFVKEIHRILRPGGALYLTSPSLHEYRTGQGWRDLGAPDHKLYFSHDNIAGFLNRHGLRLIARPGGTNRGIKVIAQRR